jgi:hypothetical protein
MSADAEEMISQVRQTREHADALEGALHEGRSAWLKHCDAWKAVMAEAREALAESRNQRHIAILRRALARRTR